MVPPRQSQWGKEFEMVSVSGNSSTVYGEGRDLYAAIDAVADQLGVQPERVGYEYDLSHFRSTTGTPLARGESCSMWMKQNGVETTDV